MTISQNQTRSEESIVSDLRRLFRQLGYRQYKMSKFEEYDLYVENKPFLLSDNVITFTDLDGRLMALKPDVTLSIAKNSSADRSAVQKLYYHENVYRTEKGSHEYREIMQMGLESLGNIDLYATGEVILLAAESLRLISPDYLLDLSHMGFITALLEEARLSGSQQAELLENISAKNVSGVAEACSRFALPADFTERISALTALYGPAPRILPRLKALSVNDQSDEAVRELSALYEMLAAAGCGDRINLDFSMVNDMSYYNGVIFQGYLEGIPSSVLSGGRYDNLMKKFGKDAGALGFAIYLSALERISPGHSPYDVDILLIYPPGFPPALVASAVKSLTEKGLTIQVQQSVPPHLKYWRLMKIDEGGSVTVEQND